MLSDCSAQGGADPGTKEIGAAEPQPSRFADETTTRLILRHREANRWLNLPGAELWPETYAEREQELRDAWTEIQRRKAADNPRRAA